MGEHYKHFDLEERFELCRLLESDLVQKEIAYLMERTESIIPHHSREGESGDQEHSSDTKLTPSVGTAYFCFEIGSEITEALFLHRLITPTRCPRPPGSASLQF